MNKIDELRDKHDALIELMRNLRADLTAHRILSDALIIAMSAPMRATVRHNVQQLSERWLAGALANSTDPTDKTVHAVQRSVDHLLLRLDQLPAS